jgi:hypothetical protein
MRRQQSERGGRVGRSVRGARLRLESLEAREVPATFTVTNTADSGPGSLRQVMAPT